MSIAEELYAALGPLVAGQCYRTIFPQEDGRTVRHPAIRFTLISADPLHDICGDGGQATDDVRVQIDIVAISHAALDPIVAGAVAALKTTATPNRREPGSFETFDVETRLLRRTLDVTFYQSSDITVP
jgi:Protein of unknown function (DUF3168)